MKNFITIHLILYSLLSFSLSAQTQIGNDIDGDFGGEETGHALAFSDDGKRVVIGAPHYSGPTRTGKVRVFEETGGTWNQVGSSILGENNFDYSGNAVAISADGSRIAVGAWRNDGTGTDAGHVRIFEENSGTWTQVGVDIDGEAASDNSGCAVSFSDDGTRVAIGAWKNDDNGSDAGQVRVYDESGGTWSQVGADLDGDASLDYFGRSVSLSSDGKRMAVGAMFNQTVGWAGGQVKVFEEVGGVWQLVGSPMYPPNSSAHYGYSVSISSDGKTVAVGGPNTGAGIAEVHHEEGGVWNQWGGTIYGAVFGDDFGFSVSISNDGERISVGSPYNGVNNKGLVQVFDLNYNNWLPVGDEIDGDQNQDRCGYATALSGDGTRVAAGAIWHDINWGTNAGQVRIFEINNETCDEALQNVQAHIINPTEAIISWDGFEDAWRHRLLYREQGATSWQVSVTGGFPRNTFILKNLSPNTTYEYRVRQLCSSSPGPYTPILTFSTYDTAPCSKPTGLGYRYTSSNTPNKVHVFCNHEPSASEYKVRWREAGSSSYTLKKRLVASYNIPVLNPNTTYEYGWRVKCGGTWKPWTSGTIFTTLPGPPPPVAPRDDSADFGFSSESLTLYPNPVQQTLNIDFGDMPVEFFRIYSAQGRMAISQTASETVQQVDVSALSSGSYILEAIGKDGKQSVQRFVKM